MDRSNDNHAELEEELKETGFLSGGMSELMPTIRSQSQDSFQLAEETNAALMQLADAATQKSVGVSSWSQKSVATRILLRSCGLLQGVILLAERGMVTESRTLVRGLFECSFSIAALSAEPDKLITLLKEDSEASRRRQGSFILDAKLGDGTFDRDELQKIVDSIDNRYKHLNPKELAKLSPMIMPYLEYQRLSDDAAHLSARSLHRHLVSEGKNIVGYQLGPGNPGENAATLYHAVMASLPIGIAVAEIFEDAPNSAALQRLGDRFSDAPQGTTI